ncbi:hypothetical protein F4859DRAFT_490319 [Xylaria cf. heliscus]|nr:hypothetical protein F4859DRAFT_490319 [Xylaria cf. heliscus]
MSNEGPRVSQGPMLAPTVVFHTPAVDFIENRMPEYHPAFDVNGFRYSPGQSRFVPLADRTTIMDAASPSTLSAPPTAPTSPQPRPPPSSISHMDFWAEVFPEAMSQLNREPLPHRGPYQPQWGIRHLSTWPNVQAKLDMAWRDYGFHNGQQHVGKFRRKFRLAMDKVTAPLQQGVNLIPDIDVVSPVTGVISLLLDAYCQAAEVRETVNSGFDDLPEAFARMDFYFKSYPTDQNILKASVGLVLAIFKAIEEAVGFYTSAQAKRAGLVILTGEEYQQKLLTSLNEISECSGLLETQAHMSFTHRMISDNNEARKSYNAIMQDNKTIHHLGQAGFAWIGNLLNQVLGILSDRERACLATSPFPSRPTTPAGLLLPRYFGPPPWTPYDLLSRLYIPDLDEADIQHILRNAGETILEDRGRAEQVLATPHFRAWIMSPGPSKLLVHGDFADSAAANRPLSPFSVLCATVVKALRLSGAEGKTISLVFFCGCHLVDNEYSGGGVMIQSLIAQLLRHFPAANIESDPGVSMQDIERGDVTLLCRLFAYLVRRLPARMTVFCLIDGINEYESEEYLHTMDEVILALLGLANEGNSPWRAKFKLLLMSPRPTVEVRQVFDQEPETLLHMAQLPMLEGGVSLMRIQEHLGVR